MVIYHSHCADGTTSAAIALDKLGKAELLAATYGDPPPDVTGKRVWIVDFSYPRLALERMKRDAVSIHVLDHHLTAQTDLAGLDFAEFDMDRSGAGMTWDHFHPHQPMPIFVKHIQDRDLWKFELEATRPVSAAYQFDMEQYSDPAEKVKSTVMLLGMDETSDAYLAMIEQGRLLSDHFSKLVANISEQAYEIDLLGERFIACNAPGVFASELGNHLCMQHMLPSAVWYSDGAEVKVSLRSTNDLPDISNIARAFGGGGHRNAAGFRAALTFMREVGCELEPEPTPDTLTQAGLQGVRVWDVRDTPPEGMK